MAALPAFSHGGCGGLRQGLGSRSGIFSWWPVRGWGHGTRQFTLFIRISASKLYLPCPKSLVKGKKWSLHLLCVHLQEAFLFHSLSTNITFPHLLEPRFEATRAVAFSHGGGGELGTGHPWRHPTPGLGLGHPTPGRGGSRPG